jgi:hypothetical protein
VQTPWWQDARSVKIASSRRVVYDDLDLDDYLDRLGEPAPH